MVSLPPLSFPCTLKLSEQHHLRPDPQAKPLESPLPCPSCPPPGPSITHSCLPNSPIHYHLPSSLLSPEPSKSPHKALPASRSPPSNPHAYFSSSTKDTFTPNTHTWSGSVPVSNPSAAPRQSPGPSPNVLAEQNRNHPHDSPLTCPQMLPLPLYS